MITAAELRARTFAKARSGYDPRQVQDCLLEAAGAMEDLEAKIENLQLLLAEAESVVAARVHGRERVGDPAGGRPDEALAVVVRMVESWGADPDRQALQLAVGRAFVDAEVAAARVLTDAERDAGDLLGLVGEVVEKLTTLVGEARSSVRAAANLPMALATYESELGALAQAVTARRRARQGAEVDGLARLAVRQAGLAARPVSEA